MSSRYSTTPDRNELYVSAERYFLVKKNMETHPKHEDAPRDRRHVRQLAALVVLQVRDREVSYQVLKCTMIG